MQVYNRSEMSEEAQNALALVEGQVNALQEQMDDYHNTLNGIKEDMHPLVIKEQAVRGEIKKLNPAIAAAKQRLASVLQATKLKDPAASKAAIEAILNE